MRQSLTRLRFYMQAFACVDDGTARLGLGEWRALLAPSTASSAEAELWFRLANIFGAPGASISFFSYFILCLRVEAMTMGMPAVKEIFRSFDKVGKGCLDHAAFSRAAAEMGFARHAYDVFMRLECIGESMTMKVTRSGQVGLDVIQRAMEQHGSGGRDFKCLLMALREANVPTPERLKRATPPPGWLAGASSALELQARLRLHLEQSGLRILELWALLDHRHSEAPRRTMRAGTAHRLLCVCGSLC